MVNVAADIYKERQHPRAGILSLSDTVLSIENADYVAGYPCNETGTPGNCDNLQGDAGLDGTYSALVTLDAETAPWGDPVPEFDGIVDHVNCNTGWNPALDEFTKIIFVKPLTHVANDMLCSLRNSSPDNYSQFQMQGSSWQFRYQDGSDFNTENWNNTDVNLWRMMALTASHSNDRLKYFVGLPGGTLIQIGSTITGFVQSTGTGSSDRHQIAARRAAPDFLVHCRAAHLHVWSIELTEVQVQSILDASLI